MALLGGNEYLVQQMIARLSETDYRFVTARDLSLGKFSSVTQRLGLSSSV